MTAKLQLVPIREMTAEDFKKLQFKEVVNVDPTLCGWTIRTGKNALKVDGWGRVFYQKKRYQEDWSDWCRVYCEDIGELGEWVKLVLDL